MNKETQNAFNLISSVCSQVSATLEDHNKIQLALQHVQDKLSETKTSKTPKAK